MPPPLRLVVYDATQRARAPRALGLSWQYGAALYRGLGQIDAAHGAHDFSDAFAWLSGYEPKRQIAEVQFWGHGKWGRIYIDREPLDRSLLGRAHVHRAGFDALRERLSTDALLWFRTCETLGAAAGRDFATALADASGARVAGHTYVIGFFQSGLHCLEPGKVPTWSTTEGLSRGSPERPELALPSSPGAPNTVTCLTSRLPPRFLGP